MVPATLHTPSAGIISQAGINFPGWNQFPKLESSSIHHSSLKQSIDVIVWIEWLQIVDPFAHADKLDRQADLLFDGEDRAPFSRAIEFGQDDAGALDRFGKHLGLRDGVLTIRGIEDEEDLVRGAFDLPADDSMDLFQFAHEVSLCVQPAGGIDNDDIEAAGFGLLAGIVGDAGRIAPLVVLDDVDADALAPDRQLLDGRGPKRIAGGDDHFLLVVFEFFGQLGDTGRLARTVDAGDHHDRRPGRRVLDPFGRIGEHVAKLGLDERLDLAGDLFVDERLANAIDDQGDRVAADIGEIESAFEFLEERLIDAPASAEEIDDPREEVASLREAGSDFLKDSSEHI